MAEDNDYIKLLTDTLKARGDWLDKSELPKLKDELRVYHTGFAAIYNIYLKKGLINEDPYKSEAKIAELEIPSTAPFSDAERLDQLTRRLANYDNQLDFLVNFYQFSAEFLSIDRIKRIVGLVRYIDWIHLTPDSASSVTRAVAEMTNQIKTGSDSLTMSIITESLSHLNKSIAPIMGYLKILSEYQREVYKLDLRDITTAMSSAEAPNALQIKKKFVQTRPGTPFYSDLAEELIKEDYSADGPTLRQDVLKKLQIAEVKPKAEKVQVSFKNILVDGIHGLGSTATTFSEIIAKIDENHMILEAKKKSFMQKLRELMRQMLNKEHDPIIYEVEYMDPLKGIPVRERINYISFRADLERKVRTLSPMAARGSTTTKLESMQEEQLIGFLERNIRDMQSLHKTLSAMDDFFKAEVDRTDRDRIKGIKPELGTIKNAILRANSKRHEYSAQKEEEQQLKRLGVHPEP